MMEDLLRIAEIFDKNTGWFLDFLVIVVSIGIASTLVIHIYRFATGKSDWMGRSTEEKEPNEQMALIQLENCHKENEELEKKLVLAENERIKLAERLNELDTNLQQKKETILRLTEEVHMLKELYEELDARYDDETYTMSQIMYTADEIAAAIADEKRFQANRDDILMNLLDYLVNTFKNFREKNPRVVIHTIHPTRKDVLIHYAHSSGHSHRVREYQPPIFGSAAGRAWRTQNVYYIPDIEDPKYEYDRKEFSRKVYRSILCIPLRAGTIRFTDIGVLSITGTPIHAYEKIEIERAMVFASMLYPLIYFDLKNRGVLRDGGNS